MKNKTIRAAKIKISRYKAEALQREAELLNQFHAKPEFGHGMVKLRKIGMELELE